MRREREQSSFPLLHENYQIIELPLLVLFISQTGIIEREDMHTAERINKQSWMYAEGLETNQCIHSLSRLNCGVSFKSLLYYTWWISRHGSDWVKFINKQPNRWTSDIVIRYWWLARTRKRERDLSRSKCRWYLLESNDLLVLRRTGVKPRVSLSVHLYSSHEPVREYSAHVSAPEKRDVWPDQKIHCLSLFTLIFTTSPPSTCNCCFFMFATSSRVADFHSTNGS